MAKILVIGAHGNVGIHIVEKLGQAGDQVLAGVRSEKQFGEYAEFENVQPIEFDLNGTIEDMAKLYQDNPVEQIIFSAGSGGATGDDQTMIIDLDGAIKSMLAAKQSGVKRYLMISAMGADDRSFWADSGLHAYYIAKHYADVHLRNSGLDYTIVRPSALTFDDQTDQVQVVEEREAGMSIARLDVAQFVVDAIHNDQTIHQILEITSK